MGKTAKYYAKNKKARDKKKKYDKEYHSSEERKKYRAFLNKMRRKAKKAGKKVDGKDYDHDEKKFISAKRNRAKKKKVMGDGKKLTAAEKKALKEKVRKLLGAGTKETKFLKEKASKLYTEKKSQQTDTNMFGGGGYMKKKSYKGGGNLTFEEKANMGNDAAKALATGKTKDGFPLTKEMRKKLEKIKKTNQNIYLMSPAPFEDDGMFEAGGGAMIPKYKKGGKLGKKKGLDFNGDGKITKADFIMMAKAKMKGKK